MIRISASKLDLFQDYFNEKTDWDGNILYDKERLIEEITRPFEPNYFMQFGTAFHELLQTQELSKYETNEYEYTCEGITIAKPIIQKARGFAAIHPQSVFEQKKFKIYEDIGCKLVCKLDVWHGLYCKELKTTGKFDYNRYADSMQWRCYIDVFDIMEVQYNVFVFDKERTVLKDMCMLTMYPYYKMEQDIMDLLTDTCQFITDNNLLEHFKDKSNE